MSSAGWLHRKRSAVGQIPEIGAAEIEELYEQRDQLMKKFDNDPD
jgi:hypothetical protein